MKNAAPQARRFSLGQPLVVAQIPFVSDRIGPGWFCAVFHKTATTRFL